MVVCMLNSDPGVILGVLAAVSTVDYLLYVPICFATACASHQADLYSSEEFSAEREAYKDACRQEGIEPINLGHPPAGVIPRPAAVPWDTISALGGSTVSLIQTDPTSGPEVFDSLIRGLRAHQDSFPEEERPGYTFPLHGEDLDRFYVRDRDYLVEYPLYILISSNRRWRTVYLKSLTYPPVLLPPQILPMPTSQSRLDRAQSTCASDQSITASAPYATLAWESSDMKLSSG